MIFSTSDQPPIASVAIYGRLIFETLSDFRGKLICPTTIDTNCIYFAKENRSTVLQIVA